MILRKTFRFEASHILPKHPGKCSRLHGHSWVLHVFVEGEVNKDTGFVMDYADISEIVKPLIEALDHHHLGTWYIDGVNFFSERMQVGPIYWLPQEFYPSSENIISWIARQLEDEGLNWSKLALEETCTSYCEISKEEFQIINRHHEL
jgi:6-pyruvoyltetrahydropterin/6-carboxytetrahydropterin synthase